MTVTLNIWTVLFIAGIIIGLLMIVLFVSFAKRYSLHVQNITLVLIVIEGVLFSELIERLDIIQYFATFHKYSITYDLLLWPFLLFYVQYVSGSKNKYGIIDGAWFLPFILGLIGYYTIDGRVSLNEVHGIPTEIALFVLFKFVVSIGFFIYISRHLRKKIKLIDNLLIHFKKTRPIQKIYRFNLFLGLGICFIYILFFINYFEFLDIPGSDDMGSLIVSCILFSLAVLVFRNPLSIDPYRYSDSVKNFFDGDEYTSAIQLLEYVTEAKPYLNSALKPDDLANYIGLSSQQFSYLLNRYLGISFADFVNSYRVDELKNTLIQTSSNSVNVLNLAYACGFNSKSTMNRIFKKHTGQSPSFFFKNH